MVSLIPHVLPARQFDSSFCSLLQTPADSETSIDIINPIPRREDRNTAENSLPDLKRTSVQTNELCYESDLTRKKSPFSVLHKKNGDEKYIAKLNEKKRTRKINYELKSNDSPQSPRSSNMEGKKSKVITIEKAKSNETRQTSLRANHIATKEEHILYEMKILQQKFNDDKLNMERKYHQLKNKNKEKDGLIQSLNEKLSNMKNLKDKYKKKLFVETLKTASTEDSCNDHRIVGLERKLKEKQQALNDKERLLEEHKLMLDEKSKKNEELEKEILKHQDEKQGLIEKVKILNEEKEAAKQKHEKELHKEQNLAKFYLQSISNQLLEEKECHMQSTQQHKLKYEDLQNEMFKKMSEWQKEKNEFIAKIDKSALEKKAMYEVLADLQKQGDDMKTKLAQTKTYLDEAKSSLNEANKKNNILTRERTSLKKTLEMKSSIEKERDELRLKLERKTLSAMTDIEAVKRQQANILFDCRKKANKFERINDELRQSNEKLLKVVRNYEIERTLMSDKNKTRSSEPFDEEAKTAVHISQIEDDDDNVEDIPDLPKDEE